MLILFFLLCVLWWSLKPCRRCCYLTKIYCCESLLHCTGLFRKLLPFHNLNVRLSLFNSEVVRSERFVCLNCLKAALTFGCRGNCFNVEVCSSEFKVSVLSWFVHSLGWKLFQHSFVPSGFGISRKCWWGFKVQLALKFLGQFRVLYVSRAGPYTKAADLWLWNTCTIMLPCILNHILNFLYYSPACSYKWSIHH